MADHLSSNLSADVKRLSCSVSCHQHDVAYILIITHLLEYESEQGCRQHNAGEASGEARSILRLLPEDNNYKSISIHSPAANGK